MKKYLYIVIIITLVFPATLKAQFYNGHRMTFGKNRVQYNDFYWEYYRFKRFDTYFYAGGRNLARNAAKIIDEELKNFEKFFSHNLQHRIIFIIYNKHSEFKQSNIGLISGDENTNIGGTAQIIDNKVFIYYEGNHNQFRKQIKSALAEVFLINMLYGGNFKQKVSSAALMNLPKWFTKGLVAYLAEDWSSEMDDRTKDLLERGKLKKINQLQDQEAIDAGHAVWNFIVKYYGEAVISNIIYLTRINKSPENGFVYVLGADMPALEYMWLDYYKKRYAQDTEGTAEIKKENRLFKPKKKRVYQHVKYSPDKRYVAYVTNYSGKRKIYIYDTQTQKAKKIIRLEHRLPQIVDYSYPVLAWHPSGKILAYVSEEKGKLFMNFYMTETDEIKKRNMVFFDKILDFSYSENGLDMAISGVVNGQTDIFVFNLSANAAKRITNDIADDLYPKFIDQGTKIIFASNRLSDTLKIDKSVNPKLSSTYDLYIYDLKKQSKILQNITNTPFLNEKMPIGIKKNTYTYLSDKNGIYNRFLATHDSTISFIDTTTHYRYYTNTYPLTNNRRNINYYDIDAANNETLEIMHYWGQDNLYEYEQTKQNIQLKPTVYRKNKNKWFHKQDSLKQVKIQEEIRKQEIRDSLARNHLVPHPDSVLIDINYYVFEREKENPYHIVYGTDTAYNKNIKQTPEWPEQKIYLTSFYRNTMVSQIDFGFLNDSYQAYVPGAYYFNPGFNILTKIGVNDLFEDYRITGGFRFAGDFNSYEYLLSVEDLKTRWDKQYIYHRLSVTNYTEGYVPYKLITNELKFRLSYPFNQVSSLRGMISGRSDRGIVLAYYIPQTLTEKDVYRYLGGLKIEYVFDNTIERSINIYNGLRFKIFGEYYQGISPTTEQTYIWGADFRYYQPIHRSLIFAGRIATSASWGTGKLLYYLGSVDNWMNFSVDVPTFDQSVRIDPNENYIFQAVATDMRGFIQNARNGTKFVLANAEIRWPIFQYLANRTLNSQFINNFQIVAFGDVGSAWSGLHPWEDDNAYNEEIIENNPIRIIINKNRSPFIYGYGFGLRSKLLGYFVRADWAWGIDTGVILPMVFYFSLSLDF